LIAIRYASFADAMARPKIFLPPEVAEIAPSALPQPATRSDPRRG